jgi:hypothetical protein
VSQNKVFHLSWFFFLGIYYSEGKLTTHRHIQTNAMNNLWNCLRMEENLLSWPLGLKFCYKYFHW